MGAERERSACEPAHCSRHRAARGRVAVESRPLPIRTHHSCNHSELEWEGTGLEEAARARIEALLREVDLVPSCAVVPRARRARGGAPERVRAVGARRRLDRTLGARVAGGTPLTSSPPL